MTTCHAIVTDEQRDQFHRQGYMVIENAIPQDMLQMMREECSYFIGYQDALMDKAGESVHGITHRSKRYFIGNRYRQSRRMWRFIYSDAMAEIARASHAVDGADI